MLRQLCLVDAATFGIGVADCRRVPGLLLMVRAQLALHADLSSLSQRRDMYKPVVTPQLSQGYVSKVL